jgi:hypothetical protein
MRSLLTLVLFAAALLMGACARARVTTEIRSDGSWTRTVVLTGQKKKDGLQMTPTLEDTFVIPAEKGWKSTEESKDDNRVLTFERSLPAGATLQGDISIKSSESIKGSDPGQSSEPGKLRLVNQVAVKAVAPHQLEYRETLHWTGPPRKLLGDIQPEDLARLKKYLPQPLATDENARALVDKTTQLGIPVVFGPGDPLLAVGLLHPDLALYRANQRMGAVIVKALEQQFGDKMQPAERFRVARQLIQDTFTSVKMAQPDPAAPAINPANNSGLTPLMFIVKAPGRVVSTNGEIDEFSGDIFWALFEDAASYQDVVMTALLETN